MLGNTMIDSLVNFNSSNEKSNILKEINCPEKYGLMTFHRPSNVDNKDTLIELLSTIEKCSKFLNMVLPLHPRTKNSLINHQLWERFKKIENLIITDSLGYLDFMKLVTNAQIVITDSGGIQKESYSCATPSVVIRHNTEWEELVELGCAVLCPEPNNFKPLADAQINVSVDTSTELYGDGNAALSILQMINDKLNNA